MPDASGSRSKVHYAQTLNGSILTPQRSPLARRGRWLSAFRFYASLERLPNHPAHHALLDSHPFLLVASVLGFTGVAGAAASIAQTLFYIFPLSFCSRWSPARSAAAVGNPISDRFDR